MESESDFDCSTIQSCSGDEGGGGANKSSISIKMEEGVNINISFKVV